MIRPYPRSGHCRCRPLSVRALGLALALVLIATQPLHPASHGEAIPYNMQTVAMEVSPHPHADPMHRGGSDHPCPHAPGAGRHPSGQDYSGLQYNADLQHTAPQGSPRHCADQCAASQDGPEDTHIGCSCPHASSGGAIALIDNATPAGAIRTPGLLIQNPHPGLALPAHKRQLLRPPNRLNA